MANILPNVKKKKKDKIGKTVTFFKVEAVLVQHTKTPVGDQNNFKSSFMGDQWSTKSLQPV